MANTAQVNLVKKHQETAEALKYERRSLASIVSDTLPQVGVAGATLLEDLYVVTSVAMKNLKQAIATDDEELIRKSEKISNAVDKVAKIIESTLRTTSSFKALKEAEELVGDENRVKLIIMKHPGISTDVKREVMVMIDEATPVKVRG